MTNKHPELQATFNAQAHSQWVPIEENLLQLTSWSEDTCEIDSSDDIADMEAAIEEAEQALVRGETVSAATFFEQLRTHNTLPGSGQFDETD